MVLKTIFFDSYRSERWPSSEQAQNRAEWKKNRRRRGKRKKKEWKWVEASSAARNEAFACSGHFILSLRLRQMLHSELPLMADLFLPPLFRASTLLAAYAYALPSSTSSSFSSSSFLFLLLLLLFLLSLGYSARLLLPLSSNEVRGGTDRTVPSPFSPVPISSYQFDSWPTHLVRSNFKILLFDNRILLGYALVSKYLNLSNIYI